MDKYQGRKGSNCICSKPSHIYMWAVAPIKAKQQVSFSAWAASFLLHLERKHYWYGWCPKWWRIQIRGCWRRQDRFWFETGAESIAQGNTGEPWTHSKCLRTQFELLLILAFSHTAEVKLSSLKKDRLLVLGLETYGFLPLGHSWCLGDSSSFPETLFNLHFQSFHSYS